MDKFLTGVVVGFFVCQWLTNQQRSNHNGGIHFLNRQGANLPRPDAATIVSGIIAKNRSL